MFKKILYITIVLLNFSTMKAEIVKSIQISGNQRVSEETIKVYGEIEINKNYEESDLNNILQNLNATNFFEDIQIRINKNVLLINLKEYPVVSQLLLIGEPSKKYKELR